MINNKSLCPDLGAGSPKKTYPNWGTKCTMPFLLSQQPALKSWHRDFLLVKNMQSSLGSFLASSSNLN